MSKYTTGTLCSTYKTIQKHSSFSSPQTNSHYVSSYCTFTQFQSQSQQFVKSITKHSSESSLSDSQCNDRLPSVMSY